MQKHTFLNPLNEELPLTVLLPVWNEATIIEQKLGRFGQTICILLPTPHRLGLG